MFTAEDRAKCEQLVGRYYAGRKFARTLYRELIYKYLPAQARVLDAGCGRYLEFAKDLEPSVQFVGVDLAQALNTRNHCCPYAVRARLERLPFRSGHFDLVISRSVIEHLSHPLEVFREFNRVLKPGGRVILSTPNKYDYVSVLASVTPYSWHRFLVSRIFQIGADDVFPTFYRANTLGTLTSQLKAAGFMHNELDAINHYPAYLMFSPLLFRLGVLYERLTSLDALRFLRGTLLAVFQKSDSGVLFQSDSAEHQKWSQAVVAPVER